MASYLEARQAGGQWLVRIEDVDRPRSRPGAAEHILATLDQLGFRIDEAVVYQSQRSSLYQAATDQLGPLVYPCTCTRKELAAAGEAPYPGTCRNGCDPAKPVRSLRLRVPNAEYCVNDKVQGRYCSNLETDSGDFPVLRPEDKIYAYQLAVVVDDQLQGITHVVRGADLLDSTPRQIYLQQCLGYRELQYLHVPIATGPDGEKLSKQSFAPAIDTQQASAALIQSLRFLGQDPPSDLHSKSLDEVWAWAIAGWSWQRIPAQRVLPSP